jgi:hypothetical protein
VDGAAAYYKPPAEAMADDFYGQARDFFLHAIDDKQRLMIAENMALSLFKGPST